MRRRRLCAHCRRVEAARCYGEFTAAVTVTRSEARALGLSSREAREAPAPPDASRLLRLTSFFRALLPD